MTVRLEGDGASRLLQLFRPPGSPLEMTTATVRAPFPNLEIRIDGDTIDIPIEGLIIAEQITLKPVSVGDKVIVVIANDGQLIYVLDKAVM